MFPLLSIIHSRILTIIGKTVFCISTSLAWDLKVTLTLYLSSHLVLVSWFVVMGYDTVTHCSGQESPCRLTKSLSLTTPSLLSMLWLITWGVDEITPPALCVLTHAEETRVACHWPLDLMGFGWHDITPQFLNHRLSWHNSETTCGIS